MILIGSNVVYKAILTDLRISTAAGAALIDNAGATVPTYADGNHLIEIYDASGRMLKGFLKAAGGGETLGDEILSNPSFDVDTTGWNAYQSTPTSVAGGETNNCVQINRQTGGPNYSAYTSALSGHLGKIVKYSAYVKSGTAGNKSYRIAIYNDGTVTKSKTGTSSESWVQADCGYSTVTSATNLVVDLAISQLINVGETMLFDTASLKQVTGPSTSGCTISSTKGGTAMDAWTYNGFVAASYNQASYYVIVKLAR